MASKPLKIFGIILLGANLVVSGVFILAKDKNAEEPRFLQEDVGEMLLLAETAGEQTPIKAVEPAPAESTDDKKEVAKAETVTKTPEPKKEPTPPAEKQIAKAPKPEPAPVKPVEPPPLPVAQCFRVGPLRSDGDTDQLMKELSEVELNSVIASHDKGVVLGYWVYLEPERSRALARLKIEELKTKGITDIALVTKSEPKYAISLGVYRSKLTAQKRQDFVRKMGYPAQLKLRYKKKPEIWLMVEGTTKTQPTKDGWKVLLKPYEGVSYKKSDC